MLACLLGLVVLVIEIEKILDVELLKMDGLRPILSSHFINRVRLGQDVRSHGQP